MTPVVVDASALAAVAFQESGWEDVLARLDGQSLHAPPLLGFELASVACKKIARQPRDASKIVQALVEALGPLSGITWHDVPPVEAVLIGRAAGITPYDASYLWLAGWLGADLVTLDRRLARASDALHP